MFRLDAQGRTAALLRLARRSPSSRLRPLDGHLPVVADEQVVGSQADDLLVVLNHPFVLPQQHAGVSPREEGAAASATLLSGSGIRYAYRLVEITETINSPDLMQPLNLMV